MNQMYYPDPSDKVMFSPAQREEFLKARYENLMKFSQGTEKLEHVIREYLKGADFTRH